MNRRSLVSFGLALGALSTVALVACSSPQTPTTEPTGGAVDQPDTTGTGASSIDPANDPAMHAEGPKAPDFTLPSLDGGQVSLSDYEGKSVVIVDFWSTDCHPCMEEIPHLVDLYEKYKDKGLIVLAISRDDPDSRSQVNSVVHDKQMTFPVLVDEDGTVMGRFTPKKDLPFSAVIAKNGAIVLKHTSYTPGDEKELAEAVAKLIPN